MTFKDFIYTYHSKLSDFNKVFIRDGSGILVTVSAANLTNPEVLKKPYISNDLHKNIIDFYFNDDNIYLKLGDYSL